MPAPRVTLGDVVLEGVGPFGWTLRYGVEPSQEHFLVTVDCAEAILEAGIGIDRPLTLWIDGEDVANRLFVVQVLPGTTPFMRRLHVVDARWWWSYAWLAPNFNVRRLGGDRFLVGVQGPPEQEISDPRLVYAPHSLNPFGVTPGATKWTAVDALFHLLSAAEPDGLGEPVALDLDPAFEGDELEDPALDMQGDDAVNTLLSFLPGVRIYQARSGTIVITDSRSPRGEQVATATRQGRLATGPESLEVDRSYLMPSAVVSLFTVEAEVLFQAEAENDTTFTDINSIDAPTLINVGEVTELSLTVSGVNLGNGSKARIGELFAAWGSFGRANRALSHAEMRTKILEHNGGYIQQCWGVTAVGLPDSINSERAAEAIASWRRQYRIAPLFWDRLEAISATRAAVLNREIPTRAPADVYCDFIRRPSMRGLGKQFSGVAVGAAVQAYRGGNIASATKAPAGVHVEDHSTGIIRIVPKKSPDGWYDFTVLGFPIEGVTPTVGGLGNANRGLSGTFANWGLIKLDNDFNLGVVMTATPSSPQNRKRFYGVEVPIPGGKGPKLYSRVFPGITSARLSYSDADRDSIIKAIRGEVEWSTLEHLLVDRSIIDDVAKANASRIQDLFRDRTVGGHDVNMDTELEPVGSLSAVRHVVARGVRATHLRFEPDAAPVDILRYLPRSTRQFIRRSLLGRQTQLAP